MTAAVDLSQAPTDQRAARFRELGLMVQAFRRDPLAVVSLILIVLFILSAILAPVLAPYPEQGPGEPNLVEKF